MPPKKHLSGNEKRKKKKENEIKASKLPKISSFFSPTVEVINENAKDNDSCEAIGENTNSSVTSVEMPTTSTSLIETNTATDTGEKKLDEVGKPNSDPVSDTILGNTCEDECKPSTSKDHAPELLFDTITSLWPTDRGHFKEQNLKDQTKRFIITNGHCKPNGPFKKDADGRSFSEKYYHAVSKSGVKIERSWLCYSLVLEKAYCETCWLFANRGASRFQDTWIDGYCDWKHIGEGMKRHESSQIHYNSCLVYEQWRLHGTLSEALEGNLQKEKKYWRQVLDRLLNVTLTLAMCNLPFRGHREGTQAEDESDYDENERKRGNFICIIELLSKYDPVLSELISKPKGKTKYMSPMIQNELIQLLSKETEKELTCAIKAAPFYSIMLDTTQDISKIDQMCEIYRYCSIEYDDNGKPKALQINESFLGFHKVEGQSGAELSEQILQTIKQRGLSISRCRGQGYDGASNMKGIYKGVQKRITDVEPSAVYVHCAAHNLNLVINDAVKDVTEMAQFYDIVQRVYVFFGLSIKRWDILSSLISESGTHKGVTIKKLNPTRWAGRYDAVVALKVRFCDVQKALAQIILCSSKADERNEATALKKCLENFNFVFLLTFQSKILQSINLVSKMLQSKAVDLAKAADLLKVCMDEMCRLRNQFEIVKKEATDTAQKWSIRPEFEKKRLRTVKRHFGELCEDQRLEDPESLCRVTVYYRTLDIITTQLNFRFTGLHEVVSSFSVLEPISLQNLSDSELYEKASSFVKKYHNDVSETFTQEILSMRSALRGEISKVSSIKDLANMLIIENYSISASFPEVCTAMLLFLTIPVTTASAERSFSKLKLVKNYLRSTMSQERLAGLALISIEQGTASKLNLSKVIDRFAEIKARKKDF